MNRFLSMTNATKAQIIVVVNAVFALLVTFGIDLSDGQQGAIVVLVNAILSLWVGTTFTHSHKRETDYF